MASAHKTWGTFGCYKTSKQNKSTTSDGNDRREVFDVSNEAQVETPTQPAQVNGKHPFSQDNQGPSRSNL
ncbi:hypothetical protein GQ600_19061 [Phytophthora cactorum]|nr:hypothetical protein GQ600_19061 [Phytophthora cactorum]